MASRMATAAVGRILSISTAHSRTPIAPDIGIPSSSAADRACLSLLKSVAWRNLATVMAPNSPCPRGCFRLRKSWKKSHSSSEDNTTSSAEWTSMSASASSFVTKFETSIRPPNIPSRSVRLPVRWKSTTTLESRDTLAVRSLCKSHFPPPCLRFFLGFDDGGSQQFRELTERNRFGERSFLGEVFKSVGLLPLLNQVVRKRGDFLLRFPPLVEFLLQGVCFDLGD